MWRENVHLAQVLASSRCSKNIYGREWGGEGEEREGEGGGPGGGSIQEVPMFSAERDSEADSFIVQLFRMDFE